MVMSQVRSLASKALVVGALGLSTLGSAQATLVVGEWDPVFDAGNFPNLSWKGTVKVDVPAPCAAAAPADITVLAGICFPLTVVEAKVVFYLTSDFTETPIDTLVFTGTLSVTDIGFSAPNVPIGLRATAPALAGTAAETYFAGAPVDFDLELDFTGLVPSVTLNWLGDALACAEALEPGCSGSNLVEPTIVYSVVQEPIGIALTGSALLALALTRRRRPG